MNGESHELLEQLKEFLDERHIENLTRLDKIEDAATTTLAKLNDLPCKSQLAWLNAIKVSMGALWIALAYLFKRILQ